VERQQGGIDLGGHAGLFADVGQVGGETVAEVEGGGGQAAALQLETLRDAGLGVEVRGEESLEFLGDAGRVGRRFGPVWRGGRDRRRLRRGLR